MASLVPEPMEKCAVWAASPSSTMLSWNQRSLRTVVKLTQRELFARTWWPSSASEKSSRTAATEASSDSPGARSAAGIESNPARRQTSSCISTMKVLPWASKG